LVTVFFYSPHSFDEDRKRDPVASDPPIDPMQVFFDGALGDVKPLRNVSIRETFRDQYGDLTLPAGKCVHGQDSYPKKYNFKVAREGLNFMNRFQFEHARPVIVNLSGDIPSTAKAPFLRFPSNKSRVGRLLPLTADQRSIAAPCSCIHSYDNGPPGWFPLLVLPGVFFSRCPWDGEIPTAWLR
jgi:hypothetical protein